MMERYLPMNESISYSRLLRVIGQDLDALGVDRFELLKSDSDYVVWVDRNGLERKRSKKHLVSRTIKNILGHDEIPNRFYYTASNILLLDAKRQLERKADSPFDPCDLSFVLRALGDYLDRKQAGQFSISRSKDSTTIRYDQKQERLTPAVLYNLGIHMYLRRRGRAGSR